MKIHIRSWRQFSFKQWLKNCMSWRVRRMSLRNRLRVSIISLVTVMVAIQFLATLRVTADADFRNASQRSQATATQVRSLLLAQLNQEAAKAVPPPSKLSEWVALWTNFLGNDPSIPDLLEKLMASSSVAVEIQVGDEAGKILATSSPVQSRVTYRSLPDFEEWNVQSLWDRLFEVLTERREYSTVVPFGVPQMDHPIYTIRVLVSSVLLRNALLPQIKSLAATSALSLLAAILLAVLFSNMVLRALDRLGKRIDQLTSGDFSGASAPARESAEIAAVSSKLNVLSEQFRDAMQLRGNIDHLLRSLEAAVVMFDPGHRLVLAGKPAERLLGRSRETMIGRTIEQIFPPETAMGALIQRAVTSKQPFRDQPTVLEFDGAAPRRLLVSVELLETLPGLHQLGTLVTLRDVESQRQLRSQLDVSTRLTAINRLTGGVAHEIKNPLNAIALHLEVLKAKLNAPAEVGPEMEVIEREIARLDRVVKTFLDFTRPVELRMKTVDLVKLAREVCALVTPEARQSNVMVRFEPLVETAPVEADGDLIKQALLNIVVNGIEAMDSGGKLAVLVARVTDGYQVTITDEGPGIPAEVRDKIFNLYFTTKREGSGIGLAMTFRVVQLHNATINFTSEIGAGTSFRLHFPASEQPATADDEPPAGTVGREVMDSGRLALQTKK